MSEGSPLESLSYSITSHFQLPYLCFSELAKKKGITTQIFELQCIHLLSTGSRHWEAVLNKEEMYLPLWNLQLNKVILCVKKKHYGISG